MIRVITDGRLGNDAAFTAEGYKFRIRVRQIDCTSQKMRELIAPEGCLQYFLERQGAFSSFNWDPLVKRQYVPEQHYSICFRRLPSDCRLELKRSKTAPPFSTSVGRVPFTASTQIYTANICGPENGKNLRLYFGGD